MRFYIIALFFVCIGINFLAINTFMALFSIGSYTNLLSYLYLRLNLFPFTVYLNKVVMTKIINYYICRCKTDYGLFSLNMFRSITLPNLFLMGGFISIFNYLNIDLADYLLKADPSEPSGKPGPGGKPQPGVVHPIWIQLGLRFCGCEITETIEVRTFFLYEV